MKPRNLIIAAVVLAALAEPFVGRRNIRRPQAARLQRPLRRSWPTFRKRKSSKWTSAKKGGPTVTLQRQNGNWMITAPEQYPADQERGHEPAVQQ